MSTPVEQFAAEMDAMTPGGAVAQPMGPPRGWFVCTNDDGPETWQGIAECEMDRPEGNARGIARLVNMRHAIAELWRAEVECRQIESAAILCFEPSDNDPAEAEGESYPVACGVCPSCRAGDAIADLNRLMEQDT